MISKQVQEKGILAKLLQKGIKILLKKECKQIGQLKIDILASSLQIIKGIIPKINIWARDINYKDLLFDEIELKAKGIKVIFNIKDKQLNIENDFSIQFKIALSENSLQTFLFSNSWNWIGDIISKGIISEGKLEQIKIINDQIFLKESRDKNTLNEGTKVEIKVLKGKLYLINKALKKTIKIPVEDKVYIRNVNIENNLIIIKADSSVSFN